MKKLYGKPLDQKVIDQLNYRKENLIAPSKGIKNLDLDNNRGAYVSLVSGATQVFYETDETKIPNIQRYPDIKKNDNVQLSNVLAQSNILLGGTLYRKQLSSSDADDYENILRGGINFKDTFDPLGTTAAYQISETYGFRPMMGITDLAINYKSTFGSIREAVLKISANSPEQLTILDKLYFRPGFPMLLEWGNVTYIDGTGEQTSLHESYAKDFLKFDANLLTIKRKIQDRRETTGFNYDGMVGRVTNFDWKYRADGGYDCSIKLISEGDVIEGVSTTFSTPDNYWTTKFTNGGSDTGDGNYDDKMTNILEAFKVSAKVGDLKQLLIDEGVSSNPKIYKTTFNNEDEDDSGKRNNAFYHISLELLLSLLNKYILQEEETGSITVRFKTDPKQSTMITYTGHVSNDPAVCVMPYRSGRAGGFNNTPTELETYLVKKESELLNVIRNSKSDYEEIDSPMKILVNVDHVLKIQKNLIGDEEEDSKNDAKLARFINTLLGNINNALGSVNDFKAIYDKDTGLYEIIDANYISYQEQIGDEDNLNTLDVVGLGSFAKNVNIESKITPQMTNMLAIAATTQGTSIDTSIEGILKYNRGITDRFGIGKEKDKSAGKDNDKEKTHPVKKALVKTRKDALKAIGVAYRRLKTRGVYADDLFSSARIPHRKYTKALYEYLRLRERGEGKRKPYAGLLPIELSLELRGITGFKIGEAFKISPEVLPDRYKEKVGFTITGIDHRVGSDHTWSTSLNTNMYMLPSDEVESLGSDFNELEDVDIDALIKEAIASSGRGFTPTNQPWSAAFISWCAQQGDPDFPASAAHTGYAQKIRSGHTDRWQVLNGEVAYPKVGDIVIQTREGNDLSFSDAIYKGKSHGDIITKVETNQFLVIGGNVSHTVYKKKLKSDGYDPEIAFYTDSTSSTRAPYIIVLRPDPNKIDINAIINAAESEWTNWREIITGSEGSTGIKILSSLNKAHPKYQERKANETDTIGNDLLERLRKYWLAAGIDDFSRD